MYFTGFWQDRDTAAELLCSRLWCGLDLSSVSPWAVVCVGAEWSSRGFLLWNCTERCSHWGERWKTFRGCFLRVTKQGLCVNTETGGLCSKCQFSSSCWSITTPRVSETRCCILCLQFGSLKSPPQSSRQAQDLNDG